MRRLFVAVLAIGLLPVSAFAWGEEGHRIVCRIAYLELDSSQQKELVRLTKAYTRPDDKTYKYYTDGCLLPDEARANVRNGMAGWEHFSRFNNWHFLNLPRTEEAVTMNDCHDDCVITGIADRAAAAKNEPDDQDRAEALFFLGHFLGDIHQPLHVSFEDDRGGNNIKPIKGNFYTAGNLHAVWDSGIVGKAIGKDGWRIYADRLAEDITDAQRAEWLGQQPLDWANESFAIATRADVDYCQPAENECAAEEGGRTLDQSYQNKHQGDVELRLRKAGVRLGNEIKKALGY